MFRLPPIGPQFLIIIKAVHVKKPVLIGPIHQLLTMQALPERGPLQDDQLAIVPNTGLLVKDGIITKVGPYKKLLKSWSLSDIDHTPLEEKYVVLPGFIDAHTHICYAGSRAGDYALRNAGKTYLEIAETGGGIWSTVEQTRKSNIKTLAALTASRANSLLQQGITTIEVKSGYGLSVQEELKMLRAIKEAGTQTRAHLITTCLAAHTIPKDFSGNRAGYVNLITNELLPLIVKEGLSSRVDAFIEKTAFNSEELTAYFLKAKTLGFDITIHADQFTAGASATAVNISAISADHLEACTDREISLLAGSATIPVVLPGASLGLGMNFAPARKLLDASCSLVIASDYNPGSAPMGQLLTQAAILGAFEKLTNAEVLAALTCRAAKALNLRDRGILDNNYIADFILFKTDDYREITYQQGRLSPAQVWKDGIPVLF